MATDSTRELEIVLSAVDNVSKDLKTIAGNLGTMNTAVQNTGTSTANMAKGVAMGTLAYNVFAGAVTLVARSLYGVAAESLKAIAQFETQTAVTASLAVSAGWTKTEYDSLRESIRAGGEDLIAVNDVTQKALNTNLGYADAMKVMAASENLAAIAGVQTADVAVDVMQAMARERPMMLARYNIFINQADAQKKFAESIGKTAQELTKSERQQALLNAVIEESAKKSGVAAAANETWGRKVIEMGDIFTDSKLIIGKLLDGAVKPIIDYVYAAGKAFTGWAMDINGKLNPTLNTIRNVISTVITVMFNLGVTIYNAAKEIIGPFVKSLFEGANGSSKLANAAVIVGRVLTAVIDVVKFIIKTFINFSAIMISAGNVGVAFVKDMWNNFKSLGDRLSNVFGAIKDAMTGNFDEAGKKLKASVTMELNNTAAAFNDLGTATDILTQNIQTDWDSLGGELVKVFDSQTVQQEVDKMQVTGDGYFQSLMDSFGKVKTTSEDTGSSSAKDAKKAEEAWKKFGESVSKVSDEMTTKFEESQQNIRDLLQQTADINVEHAKNEVVWKADLASAYVDQEEKIAAAKKDIEDKKKDYTITANEKVEGDNIKQHNDDVARMANELQVLEASLVREQAAYDQRKNIELVYGQQVEDERKKRSLTEFERQFNDLQTAKTNMELEYQQKLTNIKGEVSAELEKQKKLTAIRDAAGLALKAFLLSGEKVTVDSINREIDKYNKLADAVSKAKSGTTSQKLGTADITKGLQTLGVQQSALGNINLTITGNQFLDDNAGQKFGSVLMDIMKTNIKM